METFAIWLLFFSLLPVLYWGFRILFDKILNILFPHYVTVEVEQPDGTWKSTIVRADNNKEFYELTLNAVKESKAVGK